MTIVLQDYKSGFVISVLEEKASFVKNLKEFEFIPLDSCEDLYEVREILTNTSKDQCLIKVKLNKNSSHFVGLTNFKEENEDKYSYLEKIEEQIEDIISSKTRRTHIHSIVKKGGSKVAKKFGEESVELVIESGKADDKAFKNEAADVLYYFLILLHERGFNMTDILKQLKKQKRKN